MPSNYHFHGVARLSPTRLLVPSVNIPGKHRTACARTVESDGLCEPCHQHLVSSSVSSSYKDHIVTDFFSLSQPTIAPSPPKPLRANSVLRCNAVRPELGPEAGAPVVPHEGVGRRPEGVCGGPRGGGQTGRGQRRPERRALVRSSLLGFLARFVLFVCLSALLLARGAGGLWWGVIYGMEGV